MKNQGYTQLYRVAVPVIFRYSWYEAKLNMKIDRGYFSPEQADKHTEELEQFLDDELVFAGPNSISGSEKLSAYIDYMRDDFTIDAWRARLARLHPDSTVLATEDSNSIETMHQDALRSFLLFEFNKLPRELQERQLARFSNHFHPTDAYESVEDIIDNCPNLETLRSVTKMLNDFCDRRERLLRSDAEKNHRDYHRYSIGFHVSAAPLRGPVVAAASRAAESYTGDEEWHDETGRKFVSLDMHDVYPGSYLAVVEVPNDAEAAPGRPSWVRTYADLPIRKQIALTPAVMDHFDFKTEAQEAHA